MLVVSRWLLALRLVLLTSRLAYTVGCSLKPNTRGTYTSVLLGGRYMGYVISSRWAKVVP